MFRSPPSIYPKLLVPEFAISVKTYENSCYRTTNPARDAHPFSYQKNLRIVMGVVLPSDEIQRNSYIDSEIGFVTSYIYRSLFPSQRLRRDLSPY